MEDKELENELKNKSKQIKTKEFSERWNKIQPRLRETEDEEEQLEPILIPNGNGEAAQNSKITPKKRAIVLGAFMLLCAIALAIVLPLTLQKTGSDPLLSGTIENFEDSNLYGDKSSDLFHRVSDEEEFYRELQASGVPAYDYSVYEIESYGLWVTSENVTKGWELEFFDEETGSYVTLDFYAEDVTVHANYPLFNEICFTTTVNGVTVQYVVESDEEAYLLRAMATYRGCGYWFEILSANENMFAVIETIFR